MYWHSQSVYFFNHCCYSPNTVIWGRVERVLAIMYRNIENMKTSIQYDEQPISSLHPQNLELTSGKSSKERKTTRAR
jgi:hypothetical protein